MHIFLFAILITASEHSLYESYKSAFVGRTLRTDLQLKTPHELLLLSTKHYLTSTYGVRSIYRNLGGLRGLMALVCSSLNINGAKYADAQ